MFEDSTFESTGRIRTRSRAWALAAFALNMSILAALVAIPLIYPEALPKQWMNVLLVAPPPPPETPRPQPVQRTTEAFHGTAEFVDMRLTAPTQIPSTIRQIGREGAAPEGNIALDNGGGPSSDLFHHAQPAAVVRPAPAGPMNISVGVAEGLLLTHALPHYPPIAVEMRVQGTVVLQATISKNGTIENLRVVGGPAVLQQAALDAVATWRYRPYLLDGKPVEVETTVNVVFNLNR